MSNPKRIVFFWVGNDVSMPALMVRTVRKPNDERLIYEGTTEWQRYPEFRGKYLSEVMPYIYAFVYTRSEVLFVRQLVALRKMPRRFHEWYGDQVSLKKEVDAERFTV